jgi:hypothetical protein
MCFGVDVMCRVGCVVMGEGESERSRCSGQQFICLVEGRTNRQECRGPADKGDHVYAILQSSKVTLPRLRSNWVSPRPDGAATTEL